MSFADLIKLKEKLGATVYNEAMFGEDGQRRRKRMPKAEFKRENKNRPREMTTKKQVPLLGAIASKRSKIDDNGPRDPRFDTRCGEFDRDKFKQDYEFVNEIRQKEAATLREQLRETTDDEEKKKIKLLLQRMKNQECEEKKLKERKELQRADKSKVNVALKDDKKPFFVSKRKLSVRSLCSIDVICFIIDDFRRGQGTTARQTIFRAQEFRQTEQTHRAKAQKEHGERPKKIQIRLICCWC